jgi:hypothetical protein
VPENCPPIPINDMSVVSISDIPAANSTFLEYLPVFTFGAEVDVIPVGNSRCLFLFAFPHNALFDLFDTAGSPRFLKESCGPSHIGDEAFERGIPFERTVRASPLFARNSDQRDVWVSAKGRRKVLAKSR